MKRIIASLLACMMLFSVLFTGCNKTETPVEDNTETGKIAREIAEKYKTMNLPKLNDGKDITIRISLSDIIPTLSEVPTAEQPTVFNSTEILRKAFQLIFPNVTIEWARTVDYSSSDSFLQYITTQLNAGTAPDIVYAWGASFSDYDWFYDFNEVLDKPNPFIEGNQKWRDIFPEHLFSSWTVSDVQGRVLALPISVAPGTSTALYYNKSILQELNLEPPKTWEEMFTVCKKIQGSGYVPYSPWGAPGSGNRKISTNLWDIQFSLGPYYAAAQSDKMDYNGDGVQNRQEHIRAAVEGHYFVTNNDYAQDMWKQVKRKYTQLFEEGYENSDYESKWTLGKVGILEDGLWRYPAELSNTERQFEFGMVPPPAISTDSSEYVKPVEYTEKGPYKVSNTNSYNILLPSAQAHGGQGAVDVCVAWFQWLTVLENNEMIILEQKGKTMGFLSGEKIPPELEDYFSNSFPKTPMFTWPGGFTSAGNEKMSKTLELWVKGQIDDQTFYKTFDDEFKKDIDDYIEKMKIDISGWNKAW